MDARESLSLTLDAFQDDAQKDVPAKVLFSRKEILSVILQNTVAEYHGMSPEEIMPLIEGDTIKTGTEEVSMDVANTIRGENNEANHKNEATSRFDVVFRSLRPAPKKQGGESPQLKQGQNGEDGETESEDGKKQILVSLHIDLEIQQDYHPGYPVINRGLYYGCRNLCKQLPRVTDKEEGYGKLEKVYSIWICLDRISKREQNTISYYKFQNYKNETVRRDKEMPLTGDGDLLEVILIRLGAEGVSEKGLLDLLYGVFSGNKETVFSYVPGMPEEETAEVSEMLSMVDYAERNGTKKGKKLGMILTVKIMKTIAAHPNWTDQQIAEFCKCDEEDVKQVREESDK